MEMFEAGYIIFYQQNMSVLVKNDLFANVSPTKNIFNKIYENEMLIKTKFRHEWVK